MLVNFILHERSYNAVRFVRAEVLERYGVYHVHFGIVQYLVIAIALVERGRCDARSCGRHGLFAVISFVMLEDDLIVFQERLVYDNILRCFCKTIERDLHLGRAARYARGERCFACSTFKLASCFRIHERCAQGVCAIGLEISIAHVVVDHSFLRDAHELVAVIRVGSGGNDPRLGGIVIFNHAEIEALLFAIDRKCGCYEFKPFVSSAGKLFERVGVVGEST